MADDPKVETTPGASGEGKTEAPPEPKTPAGFDTATGLWSIAVDGQQLKLTPDEMVKRAQQSTSANQRWEEAAAKEKAANVAIQFQADFEAVQHGNEDAFRRISKAYGYTDEYVEAKIAEHRATQARAAVGGEAEEPAEEPEEDTKVTLEKIVEKVAAKVQANLAGRQPQYVGVEQLEPRTREVFLKLVNKGILQEVNFALDKDPFLGRFMKAGSDEQKREVQGLVKEGVLRRVTAGKSALEADTISEVLQEVRAKLSALGARPTNEPIPAHAGLGAGGAGGGQLYQSADPPKRPKGGLTDPDFEDYLVNLLQYEGARSEGDNEL